MATSDRTRSCLSCNGVNLYESVSGVTASRAASTGRTLLPGLGGFFSSAEFEVIVCGDCGFTHLPRVASGVGETSTLE